MLHLGFETAPPKIRGWILASPNGSEDFREFFDKGGRIALNPDNGLPYYSPTTPPTISVDRDSWQALQQSGAPAWPQRHMFGTLAHEIGHDRFNTGTVPFTGKTAEEYVQYRSRLEAQAIFTAFPIFKDLEHLPEFKNGKPFRSIGYLNEVELGALYGDWKAGKLDDAAVVKQMTAKVADAPYTLNRPVLDQNSDGKLTHRDAYLQDYKQYVEPKLNPQSSLDAPVSPADKNHPDNAMLVAIRDGVQKIDQTVNKPWDQTSERLSRCLLAACKDDRERYGGRTDGEYALAANALTQVDQVVMGKDGRHAFAVQGGLNDPSHRLAAVDVAQAIRTPLEVSDAKLETANVQITQQLALAQQQELVRGPEDPNRGGPTR